MTKPKRHHYLPEFYLHGFAANGIVQVYDKQRDEYRGQQPVNTAVKSHYYAAEDADGNRNTDIETMLSEIESLASKAIEKASSCDTLTSEDRDNLAIFVAFLWNRVPDFEHSINKVHKHAVKILADAVFSDEETAKRELARFDKDTGNSFAVNAKEIVEFHKKGAYKIEIHRNASLLAMLTTSFDFANYFRQMDWAFIHAPNGASFVTSDNPFFLYPPPDLPKNSPYGVGILLRGAIKLVPLTQSMVLAMYDKGDSIHQKQLGKRQVREININLARVATRFIIARDEPLLRLIVERSGTKRIKREGRIRIG